VVSAVDTLSCFEILRDFSREELEVLAGLTTPESVARGAYLCREGEEGDALYFLYEGTLVADKLVDADSGVRKDLAILPAFALVGEMALLDRHPRSAGIRAEVSAQVLKLSRQDFERLLAQRHDVAYKLLRALYLSLSQRLRDTNDELIALYDIGKLVAGAPTSGALAPVVLERLMTRLGAAFAYVAVQRSDHQGLRIQAAVGEQAKSLRDLQLPAEEGLISTSVRDKKPILIERLLGELEPWEGPSMIVTPLVIRDEAVGALVLGSSREASPHEWRLSDLSLAAAVANLSAPTLVAS
jgi:CRP-like cAMP-binding protein